ncbi:MAG: hypothetical protein HW414_1860 [Dehalococcoidia bacterium]|nr:hypothetical protein [Dehalococcoidia bacterium]
MQQRKEDSVRLRHMLDYAQKAVQFTSGRSRADFDADDMLAMATIHSIEIVGEAVKTISGELRKRYPGIPWDLISGTRNRLAHGYIDVDLDVIWTIVTEDLPPLIKELKRILKKESGES